MSGQEFWELRSPQGRAATKRRDCAPRLGELQGIRIGFIDNGFPNASIVVNRVRERLSERFDFSAVVNYRRHRATGYFEPKDLLEELAKECDVVVLGAGA